MSTIKDLKISLPQEYDPKSIENNMQDIITQMAGVHPVGTVTVHAGLSVPAGFLECNGQSAGRKQYKDLYAIIGVKYGGGDGSTTFNLPNLTAPMGTKYILKY